MLENFNLSSARKIYVERVKGVTHFKYSNPDLYKD